VGEDERDDEERERAGESASVEQGNDGRAAAVLGVEQSEG